MRRVIAVLLLGALVLVFCPSMAVASSTSVLPTPMFDLRAQLLMRFFGETGNANASLGDLGVARMAIASYALPAVVDVPDAQMPLGRYARAGAFALAIPQLSLRVPTDI